MSSVSYANIAANGSNSSTKNNSATSSTLNSPVNANTVLTSESKPEIESKDQESVPEPNGTKDSESTVLKEKLTNPRTPKEKKLAPAPLPTTNVWGTSSSSISISNVDEYKWPTPDKQNEVVNSKSTQKSQKFIKPITKQWVPITPKIILPPNTRGNPQASTSKKNQKNTNKNKNNRNNKKSSSVTNKKANGKTDVKKEDKEVEKLAGETANLELETDKDDKKQEAQSTEVSSEELTEASTSATGSAHVASSPSSDAGSSSGSGSNLNGHSNNGHGHYNRQYKVNYRNVNRYSLPNNNYNGFIPYSAYHHQSLPSNYYPGIPVGPQFQAYQPQAFTPQYAQQFAQPPVVIPPPISPKQDPISALSQQVDYYFSFQNLIKDAFLRRTFDKETGYIKLDTILNFNRVQIIVNQIKSLPNVSYEQAVVEAIKSCTNVEIKNEDEDLSNIEIRVKGNFQQWILD